MNLKLNSEYGKLKAVITHRPGREIERLRAQHERGEFPDVCVNCNECKTSKTKKRFFFEELVP